VAEQRVERTRGLSFDNLDLMADPSFLGIALEIDDKSPIIDDFLDSQSVI
jgi:hypothetical protein